MGNCTVPFERWMDGWVVVGGRCDVTSVSQGGLLWACATYTILYIHTQLLLCLYGYSTSRLCRNGWVYVVLYESYYSYTHSQFCGSTQSASREHHVPCRLHIKGGKGRRLRLFTIWTLAPWYALESPIVTCVCLCAAMDDG